MVVNERSSHIPGRLQVSFAGKSLVVVRIAGLQLLLLFQQSPGSHQSDACPQFQHLSRLDATDLEGRGRVHNGRLIPCWT